jgi:hypothetical protein
MTYLLLSLSLFLSACSSTADYPWKIPPGKEAQFKLDRKECDRSSTEAHPNMLPVVPESMRGDLEASQEALYKRCMQEKGYQIAK